MTMQMTHWMAVRPLMCTETKRPNSWQHRTCTIRIMIQTTTKAGLPRMPSNMLT